jgi:hypothetical protein
LLGLPLDPNRHMHPTQSCMWCSLWFKMETTSVVLQDCTDNIPFSCHITDSRMLCTLAQQALMCCLYFTSSPNIG